MKRKFLVILNHSLYVRNFLATGLLSEVKRANPEMDLVVYVDSNSYKQAREMYSDLNIQKVPSYFSGGWLKTRIRRYLVELTLVSRERVNSSYEVKVKQRENSSFIRKHITRFLRTLNRFYDTETLALGIENKLLPTSRKAFQHLEEMKPDFIFYVSVIYDISRILEVLKAAKSLKIPVYSYVASWDNLTTKGPFYLKPEKLLVWGSSSKQHALEEHQFSEQQVGVVGAPQFDIYFENDPEYSRETYLASKGLSPSKKTILFVGTTRSKMANEPEIVKSLQSFIESSSDPQIRNCQIWYRPHPRMPANHIVELRKLPGIFFDDQMEAQIQSNQFGYTIKRHEMIHYSRMLKSVDLIISAFSTMIIEAALFGKPSVVVKFSQEGSDAKFMSDNARFKHLQEVLCWDYVETATNLDACFRLCSTLLNTPVERYSDRLKEQAKKITANSAQFRSKDAIQKFLSSAVQKEIRSQSEE